MDTRRCKCGCRTTDATTAGYWHGCWWFASKACYDAYAGRCHAKNGTAEQPDEDEQVATGDYTLNRELLKRAHALRGTDRDHVESLLRKFTPFNESADSERAMRAMCEE